MGLENTRTPDLFAPKEEVKEVTDEDILAFFQNLATKHAAASPFKPPSRLDELVVPDKSVSQSDRS
jgi:hypothetical protein